MDQHDQLVWLFGRGASVACGLHWTLPEESLLLNRSERERLVREELPAEMDRPGIDTSPYRHLLAQLAERTCPGKHHLFLTTNWDTLLEREINSILPPRGYTSTWLPNTLVFHLNGTIEAKNEHRSPTLLENDAANARTPSDELDMAVAEVSWSQHFVVVGMSFACPTDRAFLRFLHRIQEEVPVGFSRWVVVNRDQQAAREVAGLIHAALPKSKVRCAATALEDWLRSGMLHPYPQTC